MLQIQQSGHETRAQGGAPGGAREVRAEGALDLLPVDDRSQSHQRVPAVELFDQGLSEQLPGLCLRRFRTQSRRPKIGRKSASNLGILQILTTKNGWITHADVGFRALFRTDS